LKQIAAQNDGNAFARRQPILVRKVCPDAEK
jgi:hypothetical protein